MRRKPRFSLERTLIGHTKAPCWSYDFAGVAFFQGLYFVVVVQNLQPWRIQESTTTDVSSDGLEKGKRPVLAPHIAAFLGLLLV